MSSPARRMRRAQARQIARQIARAPRMPPPPVPESPSDSPAVPDQATRLAQHGVSLERSLLWTPKSAR